MDVSITKSISVYPKLVSDDPPKILTLSNLDRQCPSLMYMVFFYKSIDNGHSIDSVSSRLESSLEATLSTWYPAAGRLSFSDGDDGKLLLNILCNNAGAILVQAVTQVKISDLGDLSVYNDFFENLVFKPATTTDGNITEMPLLVAQVTKFECGGYSIGMGSSHSVFDGISAFEFFKAWARESQLGGSKGGGHKAEAVVHERGKALLLMQNIEINPHSTISNNNINPTAIHHLYQLINQKQQQALLITSDDDQETNNNTDDLVFKTFRVSSAMIQSLRDKAAFGGDNPQKTDKLLSCSSFQLLAAHLWKVRTKALGVERERKVCLQFAVDIRKKMVPQLPKGFSGNGYVLASIITTAGELEEQSHRYIIERINETKNSINEEYVKAYIKALQAQEKGTTSTLPPLPELTVVSDWTRIPFHTVDFFGEEAVYASPLIPPVPHVAYFMQNPIHTGAVDLRIGMLPSLLPHFSHHFLNI
ncbi:hypothetical protein ACP275_05G147400 [Erythranthe tilingii]